MQHVTLTIRFRFIRFGIRLLGGSEHLSPISSQVDFVSVVQSVTRFMSQDPHQIPSGSPFDFEHLLAFHPHQSRVCEIKRNRKTGNPIGSVKLAGQPHVRTKRNLAVLQLLIQLSNRFLQNGPFDVNGEIPQTQFQKPFIGKVAEPHGFHSTYIINKNRQSQSEAYKRSELGSNGAKREAFCV